MKHTKGFLFLGLFFFFCSFVSHADWEGSFTTQVTGRNAPEVSGRLHMKKDKLRMDAKTPAQVTTIANLQLRKAWTLLATQKMVMETDLNQVEDHNLFCGAEGVDACLKKKGFKKSGTETTNGYPCTVYEAERTSKNGKKTQIKIWKPDALKEVPAVKSVVTDASSGTVAETNFTDIKIAPQPESLFAIPKGYQSMGSPQDLLKNLGKGFGGMKLPGGGGGK